MPDERSHGPWVIDPDTMIHLRLRKGREALSRGEPELALVEGEELLEDHPGQVDALQLVGDAALSMHDAPLARATFEQLLERQPDRPHALEGLAVALFECVEFRPALEQARAAIEREPGLARCWYYQGLLLERLADQEGANRCFDRAHALSPEAWPLPRNYSDHAWEEALAQGRRLLPGPIRGFYAKVPLRWERFPAEAELRAPFPPLSPLSYALFEGTPPLQGDPWTEGPKSVRLYRGNLRHGARKVEDLARRIAESLLQEAAAWLGVAGDELI